MKKDFKVVLSIGANIGDIEKNFAFCIKELKIAGLRDLKRSKLYKNQAFGCPPGTPDFFNAAVSGLTDKIPEDLLFICKEIEMKCGRPERHAKWTSRPMDIDIVFYGNLIMQSEKLRIPHEEALKRLFVIFPVCEIEPTFLIPTLNQTVAEYLKKYFSYRQIEEFSKNAISFPYSA